jgi:hypothetical protein
MDEALSTIERPFRVHFIRIQGPEIRPKVLMLFVESTRAEVVYQGLGSWSQCKRWVARISACSIAGDQLAVIEKRLKLKRLATIDEVRASLSDLDSAGFHPAGSSSWKPGLD